MGGPIQRPKPGGAVEGPAPVWNMEGWCERTRWALRVPSCWLLIAWFSLNVLMKHTYIHTYKHTYIQSQNSIHAECTTCSAWITNAMMKASAVATVADVFQGRTATRTACCMWTNPHRTTWPTSFATRSTRCGTNSSSCKLAAVLVAINWEWLDKTGKRPITNHYISTRIPLYRNTSTSLLMAVAVVRLYWFRFFQIYVLFCILFHIFCLSWCY